MTDRPLTRREIRELERLREIAETIAAESAASGLPGAVLGDGTGGIAAAMAPFFEERIAKEQSLLLPESQQTATQPPPYSAPPSSPIPLVPPTETTASGSVPQVTAHTGPFSAPLLPNPVSTGPIPTPFPTSQPVQIPVAPVAPPVATPVSPPVSPSAAPSFQTPIAPVAEPSVSAPAPALPNLPVTATVLPAEVLAPAPSVPTPVVPDTAIPAPAATAPAPVTPAPAPVTPAAAQEPAAPVQETPKPVAATRRSRTAEARAAEQASTDKTTDLFRSGPIDIVSDTNSLVIDMPKDITNSTLVIADSGVVLTTGSITLPTLKPETGEISLVAAGEAADAALAVEKREFVVTGIEPQPARRHMRSRKRSSVFPTRLRKGMGQVYLVLFSAIMTAAVLGMLIAAYMLGIIHL